MKNILKYIGAASVLAMATVSCQNFKEQDVPVTPEINFEIEVEDTDLDADATKAVQRNWEEGAEIMLFFNGKYDSYVVSKYNGGRWTTDMSSTTLDFNTIVGNGKYKAVYHPGDIKYNANDVFEAYEAGSVFVAEGNYKYYQSGNGGRYVNIKIRPRIYDEQFQLTICPTPGSTPKLSATDGWKLTVHQVIDSKDSSSITGIKKLYVKDGAFVVDKTDTVRCMANPDGIAFFPLIDTTADQDHKYQLYLTNGTTGDTWTRTVNMGAKGTRILPKHAYNVTDDLENDWEYVPVKSVVDTAYVINSDCQPIDSVIVTRDSVSMYFNVKELDQILSVVNKNDMNLFKVKASVLEGADEDILLSVQRVKLIPPRQVGQYSHLEVVVNTSDLPEDFFTHQKEFKGQFIINYHKRDAYTTLPFALAPAMFKLSSSSWSTMPQL